MSGIPKVLVPWCRKQSHHSRSSAVGVKRLATTTLFCYAAAAATLRHRSSLFAMAFSSSTCGSSTAEGPLSLVLQQKRTDKPPVVPSHPLVELHHIKEPIGSTQDEVRRILLENENETTTNGRFVTVIADQQQAGRGTNGRNWEASQGNLYMTMGIPMDKIPVMLTMLPLQIAVLVSQRADLVLDHCAASTTLDRTRVKWPNDVLLNDAKLSGTLIESVSVQNQSWFLIGIGVNVQHAPSLTSTPGKQIRPAVSLQDYCDETQEFSLPPYTALYFGVDLAYALADWATENASVPRAQANQAVLDAWKAKAEFGKAYEIRSNNVEDESNGSYQGERVVAVDIAPDGQLKIRGADGQERLLVADYFF